MYLSRCLRYFLNILGQTRSYFWVKQNLRLDFPSTTRLQETELTDNVLFIFNIKNK